MRTCSSSMSTRILARNDSGGPGGVLRARPPLGAAVAFEKLPELPEMLVSWDEGDRDHAI
jgi:hypothetical protein